jgi:type VI secretion system protein ImpA
MLNVDDLLLPVTGDAPAGANLEYSPEFAELERTAAGKPERQMGASVAAAEEPDWRALVEQSTALLKATKDLRVANHLIRGLLRVDGFAGLADGLLLLRGLIDRYWTMLYPLVEADEDHDPTFRVNAMAALTHRDVIQAIRAAPLLRVKGIGAVALRDIDMTVSPDPPSAQAATIEAAFQQVPLPELSEAFRMVQRCSEEAGRLADSWGTLLESRGPDFTEFRRALAQASQVLRTRLEQRKPASNGADTQTDGEASLSVESGGGSFVRGTLRSREDVVRALDAICAYYARHEPSSPVPLLLERCKRLVTMSFLDIVKDMLPEGISTIETVVGKTRD